MEVIKCYSIEERRGTNFVAIVDFYPTLNEQFDHLFLSMAAGIVEQCLTLVDLVGEARMFFEDLSDCLKIIFENMLIDFVYLILVL